MVDPIPAGLEDRLVPHLMIDGAAEGISFYREALGATERRRCQPRKLGWTSVLLHRYVARSTPPLRGQRRQEQPCCAHRSTSSTETVPPSWRIPDISGPSTHTHTSVTCALKRWTRRWRPQKDEKAGRRLHG